jgi:hypothetical protein
MSSESDIAWFKALVVSVRIEAWMNAFGERRNPQDQSPRYRWWLISKEAERVKNLYVKAIEVSCKALKDVEEADVTPSLKDKLPDLENTLYINTKTSDEAFAKWMVCRDEELRARALCIAYDMLLHNNGTTAGGAPVRAE